jgi:glycolate oxidase iron-sulfur subunit
VPRPLSRRLLRRLILGLFPDRRRLTLALRALGLYQRSGLRRLVRASGALTRFPSLSAMESLLPALDSDARREPAPVPEPSGPLRGSVGLLRGCVQAALFPEVNRATVELLARAGYRVRLPATQGCCGALHLHWGARDDARRLARANVAAFDGVDWVVTNAAGCGATLREYGHLLADEPGARALSARVRDVSELLTDALPGPRHALPLTVTYHEPCHLAHAQRVREAPRALLRAIPGLRLVELPEADVCCGSAGVYNLLEPGIARELLDRKLNHVVGTGADMVVSGNPGCLLQLRMGLGERRSRMRAHHPVELLAWSVAGAGPAGSR